MLHAAIIPCRDRILRPNETALESYLLGMIQQKSKERLCFQTRETIDSFSKFTINVQRRSVAIGVFPY
jgi:hypothetical protein